MPRRDMFEAAYERSRLPEFSFTPDVMDPELTSRRTRAIRRGGVNRSQLLNELSRGGLQGTSAGLDYLRGADTDLAGMLEDITGDVFGRQRRFAEQQYSGAQSYRQDLELLRLQDELNRKQRERERFERLLGGAGGLAGRGIQALLGGGTGLLRSGVMMGEQGNFDPFMDEDYLYG